MNTQQQRRPQRVSRHEGGQAIIEFALTAILFLGLSLFLIDGSRILWHYVTLHQAALVGARYASIHGATTTSPQGPAGYEAVKQQVRDNAFELDPAHLTITVTWEGNSNVPGHRVTVSLNYTLTPVTSLVWNGSLITLHTATSAVLLN